MFDTFQDWNQHFFLKITVLPNFVIYLIKKNISIQGLKEALGVKDEGVGDGAEGAQYDGLEEVTIGKMDNLFETESETSEKGSREL